MGLDSLLAGIIVFSSVSFSTPNVQPNPDDYELSIGLTNDNYYLNRQWERELGEPYVDDLFWFKIDEGVYFKPEYMDKQSQGVRYLKLDWRNKWKNLSYGFTTRNDSKNLFSSEFETFSSIGYIQKKKYNKDKIELDITIDGYLPPDDNGVTKIDNFEFENKFKLSWNLTKKVKLYNLGEVSKLQSKKFYKFKIGMDYEF